MFVILACVNVALAVLTFLAPRAGVLAFVVMLLLTPTYGAFDQLVYRAGIFVFDWYFCALVCFYLATALQRIQKPLIRDLIALGVFVIGALLVSTMYGKAFDKYLLRDLRPVLVIVEGYILIAFLRQRGVSFDKRTVLWMGVIAGLAPFIGFGLVLFDVYRIDDLFYVANAYRFLSIATYAAAVALIWLASDTRTIIRSAPCLSMVLVLAGSAAIILSGARTLVVATVVGAAFAAGIRLYKLALVGAVAGIIAGGFALVSIKAEVGRVTQAVSVDGIIAQLSNRFGPAIDVARTMTTSQWITGAGMGTTFEIPWFAYRGLDVNHNSIDSMYLTMVIKFGLFSLMYFVLFVRSLGIQYLPAVMKRGVGVFIALVGVVFALPYQRYTLGITVMAVMIAHGLDRRAGLPHHRDTNGKGRYRLESDAPVSREILNVRHVS